ncbi:hypothetical protein DFH06DRAFT_567232 [Mycena polygramma]|nr:hypothetical protein DFH06DRAFT_567232 [Mycena polygramma]
MNEMTDGPRSPSTSSVLTLPNEITSEIFLHFLPVYPHCPPLTGTLSPTSLTHVCHQWREIALTTPSLWRAISLHIESDITFTEQEEIMHTWLTRSRCCPLSIEIAVGLGPSVYGAIVDAALHSERWEYLKLHISPAEFPPIDSPMPLLRHLDLAFIDFSYPKGFDDIIAFRDLPLLTEVVFDLWNEAVLNIELPWAQLTSLTLVDGYMETCVPFIQKTPNLVHCTLSDIICHPSLPDLRLLSLKSLSLIQVALLLPVGAGYIKAFVVPGLRSLQIPESHLGSNPVPTLKSFISKSGCKLDHVCITGDQTVSKDFYRRAFPAVGKFTSGTISERQIF